MRFRIFAYDFRNESEISEQLAALFSFCSFHVEENDIKIMNFSEVVFILSRP